MDNVKKVRFGDVLSISPFRSLWVAQIFSQLSVSVTLFTLALLIYQHTGSNSAVSVLFLSYGIPSLLFGVLAGIIVDHLDKRRVLIACDLLRACLVVLLFFVFTNPILVYFFIFFHATLTQFYVPAEAPTIPRLVPDSMLVTANSLFSFTYYSSLALGFIIAGPLLRIVGPHVTLLIVATSFLIAAITVSRLPPQPGTHRIRAILRKNLRRIIRRVVSDLTDSIRYIRRSPRLLDALLLLTGTQIILTILGTLGPGFADRVLEIDIRDTSLYISAPVVFGIILGALWVGSVGYVQKSTFLIRTGILTSGTILMTISLLVRLSRVDSIKWFFDSFLKMPIIVILFFILGVANSLLDVPANSTLQRESDGSMRSRVYGMLSAAVGGIGIIPVIAGGILADILGVGKVIFFLGFFISLYGLLRIRYNR